MQIEMTKPRGECVFTFMEEVTVGVCDQYALDCRPKSWLNKKQLFLMNHFGEILSQAGELVEPQGLNHWPDRGFLFRCAQAAEKLPLLEDLEKGDHVFRGTLLHRIVFGVHLGVLKILDNRPTEDWANLNATRSLEDATWYATSFGTQYETSDKLVDPVIMVFDATELTLHMEDPGRRWFIPKRLLPQIDVRLFFPGRNKGAEETFQWLRIKSG